MYMRSKNLKINMTMACFIFSLLIFKRHSFSILLRLSKVIILLYYYDLAFHQRTVKSNLFLLRNLLQLDGKRFAVYAGMVELMRYMLNGSHPEGYAVIPLGIVKPKKMRGGLSMQLLTLYRGGFLQGEIWKLKNESGHTLSLHPRQFYQHNVRAASLVDESLKNCDETILYRIVSHE